MQSLFDNLPDFEQLFGDPGPADAVSTFAALPEGKTYEDKMLLGIWQTSRLVGVVDCIAAYPTAQAWTIGLLVLDEQSRGRGIGTALIRLIERLAKSQGAGTVRCPVRSTNTGGATFLTRLGYRLSEESIADPLVFERHGRDASR